MAKKVKHKTSKLIYEILIPHGQEQLKVQADSIESIEAKAGYLIASEGIILTIIVSLFSQNGDPCSINLTYILGTISLVVGILFIIAVFWNRYFDIGLPISKFYDEFHNKTDNRIRFKALYTINLALESNAKSLKWKSRFFLGSLIMFSLTLLVIVFGFAFHLSWNYNNCMDNNNQNNTAGTVTQQNQSNNQQQSNQQSNQGQVSQSNNIWSISHQTPGTTPSNLIKGGEDFGSNH